MYENPHPNFYIIFCVSRVPALLPFLSISFASCPVRRGTDIHILYNIFHTRTSLSMYIDLKLNPGKATDL